MIRNLKILGLALTAMFALGAVMVVSASAEETKGWLTSDGLVTLDITTNEEGLNTLTSFGSTTRCPGSIYTGHETITQTETEHAKATEETLEHSLIEPPVTTITVTPHYKQETCITHLEGGEHKTTITTNGCDFHFTVDNTVGPDRYEITADLECPKNKAMEIDIYPFKGSELGGVACTITVQSQTGLKGTPEEPVIIETDTSASPHHLSVYGTFSGIKVKRHGFGCEEAETENGELHIDATGKGKNAVGEPTEITVTDSRG